MAATLTDPLLGHLVDGRYEVLSRIARGGMATVYLAVDRRLDRAVALKVMHPHLAEGGSGSDFVARFRREARAAARLTHPGLVSVFDQGVDGETSYLTMEYVDGTNLRRHLTEHGALTVAEAFTTAEAVLDALAAAHRTGLVHRDVKPENVLLALDGRIKVADFGLARAVTEVTATTTGTVLGTVAYLGPELVAHGISDARTDVYALGILLYEMLTGSQPFTGTTPIHVAYQHVNNDVPAPSDRVPWLPVEVDELVAAFTARDPADRPADASAALTLLRRTRAMLDPGTLGRRADVASASAQAADIEPGPGPRHGDDDGIPAAPQDAADARRRADRSHHRTAALERPMVAPGSGERSDKTDDSHRETGLSRTMALRIGTGLHPPDDQPTARDRARRARRALLALLVLTLLAGGAWAGSWWWSTIGPGAWTSVPTGLVGAQQADAEELLDAAGLRAASVEAFDPAAPPGTVVGSDPGEGQRVREGAVVDLTVSKGPDLRTVPGDLVGLPVGEGTAALQAAGFVVPEPERVHDDAVPTDHVLTVSAEPGATLPVDSEVRLTVSAGPAPVTISSVVGAERDVAIAQLEDQGLRWEETTGFSEQYPAGVVMAQSPAPNTPGHRLDTVQITVSQGPPMVQVPDVVGSQFGEAEARLEALGFVVARENVLGGFFGTVRSQDVAPGESAPKGSTITLTIV